MYGCESWTIKKAECRRIDTFELWCWRRLLRSLWATRRLIKSVNPKGNHSWIFIGRTDADAEAPILWPPDAKNWSLEKILMLRKIEGRRRKGKHRMWWLMASPTRWTWVWVSSRCWWWKGKSDELQSMGLQRVGHDWVMELNWGLFNFSVPDWQYDAFWIGLKGCAALILRAERYVEMSPLAGRGQELLLLSRFSCVRLCVTP